MLVIRLAGVQLRQGRFAAATKAAESAVATLERRDVARSSNWLLSSLLHAGWGHSLSGDYVAAISAFERRNANLAADPKAIRGREGGSVVWGYALIRMGRAEEALPMLKAHYEVARAKAEKGYAALERAGMYAYALHRAGRSTEAAKLFAVSVTPLLEARRKARAADRLDALLESIANWIVEGYLEFLSTKAAAGDAQAIGEMFRFADVARGSSVQRAVAQAASRATIREPELAELARKEQDLANRAVALTRITEDLTARPADRQPKQVIAGMRRDIQSMEVERDAVKKEIAARFPGYAQLIEPQPATVAQVQQLLRTGEVMVSLYSAHDRTYIWAIPRTGAVRFAQSNLSAAAIAQMVDKLRGALDVGEVSVDRFPAYDVRLAYSLYENLLKPLEDAWSGAQTLIVVPHGSLGRLPFAALPAAAPGSAVHSAAFAGYRDVDWLLKRIAIIQLPSVTALPSLRAMDRSAAAPSAFVGVGDPAFRADGDVVPPSGTRSVLLRNLAVRASGDSARPFATAEFKRLPPLPDTAQEVREIAAILKASDEDVLLGVQASETNVKQRKLDAYRVVMFATHGLVPGDFDGLTQPALALSNPDVTGEKDSDGLLTLEEVLGLKLNADWVVLSACNTASPDGAGSEAVSGLGRAFFYAGAKSLLVSNWPVETVSARLLTTDLFRRPAQDPAMTRAEALRASMLGLLQTGGATDGSGKLRYTYAHPMFWAPFTLIGDGSR
jgi:CHAT domain-containing protein